MPKLVLMLADPIFSRVLLSPAILCMRWHAEPPIELWQWFGGSAPDFFGLLRTLTRNSAVDLIGS